MKRPLEYRWLKAHGFNGFIPWSFIEGKASESIREQYRIETGKDILVFARRQDNDDIAGFKILNGVPSSKIVTVHLTWSKNRCSEPFPISNESENIFDWLKEIVIPISEEWMSEEELKDLIENK